MLLFLVSDLNECLVWRTGCTVFRCIQVVAEVVAHLNAYGFDCRKQIFIPNDKIGIKANPSTM